MNDWLKRQLADGLPAFAGSSVTGTLVLKQEVVNELLAELLVNAAGSSAVRVPSGDLSVLGPFVKSVSVRAETGVVMVDFRVGV